MSSSPKRRHRRHANPFAVRGDVEPLDCVAAFGQEAPLAVDIGFGSATFLLDLGRQHPEWNVLGLEIRQHLVEYARHQAREAGLANVHVRLANANLHLDTLLRSNSVSFVSVNFPDPWYKKRHRKRRVVQPTWIDMLSHKLAAGAQAHVMTDYEPLGREILRYFEAHGSFENVTGRGRFASDSTTQIRSERELWHLGRGDPIYRLHFRFFDLRTLRTRQAPATQHMRDPTPGLSADGCDAT